MDLEETPLPGVGVRYRLRTRSGEVLAVAGPVLTRFAEPLVGPVPSAASP